MRDPKRIDKALKIISRIWKKVPDWRFTQLVVNIIGPGDPFYLEDDTLIEILKKFEKKLK